MGGPAQLCQLEWDLIFCFWSGHSPPLLAQQLLRGRGGNYNTIKELEHSVQTSSYSTSSPTICKAYSSTSVVVNFRFHHTHQHLMSPSLVGSSGFRFSVLFCVCGQSICEAVLEFFSQNADIQFRQINIAGQCRRSSCSGERQRQL